MIELQWARACPGNFVQPSCVPVSTASIKSPTVSRLQQNFACPLPLHIGNNLNHRARYLEES